MTGNGRSRYNLLHWPGDRLLALLLVGAFLLCHGVLGSLHLCSAPQASASHTHEHLASAEVGAGAHDDGQPACHLMGAEHYFAVLLVAFLGLVFGLLGGNRSWGGAFAFRLLGRRFRPTVLRLPRGPTAPLIQVFRL